MHTGVTFSASHLKNLTKGSVVKGLSCPREVLSFIPVSQTREGKKRGRGEKRGGVKTTRRGREKGGREGDKERK